MTKTSPFDGPVNSKISLSLQTINWKRCRLLALFIMIKETALIFIVDIRDMLTGNELHPWLPKTYFYLHLFLIAISLGIFVIAKGKLRRAEEDQRTAGNFLLTVYPMVVLCGLSLYASLDQLGHGQISVYETGLLICASLVLTGYPQRLAVYTPPYLLFLAGIFLFQKKPSLVFSYSLTGSMVYGVSLVLSRLMYKTQFEILSKNAGLEELNRRLDYMSFHDQLTALPNRRNLYLWVEREMANMHRYDYPCSIIIMDIDHFKRLNDKHGHPAGDAILKGIAQILLSSLREGDTAARWGGEEFLIFLSRSDTANAEATAERIRKKIEGHKFHHENEDLKVTASFGIARLHGGGKKAFEAAYSRADTALYRAKKTGRNRVKVAEDKSGGHMEAG